jgi:hypothetical protein
VGRVRRPVDPPPELNVGVLVSCFLLV